MINIYTKHYITQIKKKEFYKFNIECYENNIAKFKTINCSFWHKIKSLLLKQKEQIPSIKIRNNIDYVIVYFIIYGNNNKLGISVIALPNTYLLNTSMKYSDLTM